MVRKLVVIEWAREAITDLDRFASFLHARHPDLAAIVAREILLKVEILADRPEIGRQISETSFRQLVLPILNASYVVQYRFDAGRVTILRVFHGREQRK